MPGMTGSPFTTRSRARNTSGASRIMFGSSRGGPSLTSCACRRSARTTGGAAAQRMTFTEEPRRQMTKLEQPESPFWRPNPDEVVV